MDEKPLETDGELLKKATNGDGEAFGEFCISNPCTTEGAQREQCHQLGIPLHLAEDFVNDALLRAVTWIEDHPAVELSRNWLFTVARNISYDWLRHRLVERRVPAVMPLIRWQTKTQIFSPQ